MLASQFGTLALALVVVGCSRTPLGLGAASLLAPDEREATVFYIWGKRGTDMGVLARTYCLTGSPRERTVMMAAVEQNSLPAHVRITCKGEPPPPPTSP